MNSSEMCAKLKKIFEDYDKRTTELELDTSMTYDEYCKSKDALNEDTLFEVRKCVYESDISQYLKRIRMYDFGNS